MADRSTAPTILIDATYCLHPDDVEAYKALAARMTAAATKREGCAFLKAGQDILDPTTFHLFEGWMDQDALDAHVASDEFQEVLREAVTLKIADRFADIYTVSSRSNLKMPS